MFKDFKSLLNINWIYFFLLLIIFWVGEINLYSAAGGNLEPWAISQLKRFIIFLPIVFFILLLQPKFIFNVTELILIAVMLGLLITLFFGYTGMGAKRWIRVGGFNLQVSEFAKISLVIFMAKYFHKLNAQKTIGLISPNLLIRSQMLYPIKLRAHGGEGGIRTLEGIASPLA
jgi:rod shape determining protein RodA